MKKNVMGLLGGELGRIQEELTQTGSSLSGYMIQKYAEKLSSRHFIQAALVGQEVSLALHSFLARKGLVPLDTFILTTHNDTLNHSHMEVCADINGVPFPLKKSSILFKQMAITMSPLLAGSGLYFFQFQDINFRGERPTDTEKDNYRSWEFTQTDLELGVEGADPEFWIGFITEMMKDIFAAIHRHSDTIFDMFGVDFPDFPGEIPVFDTGDMIRRYGDENVAEVEMARQTDSPITICTNLPREFYDYRGRDGKFLNFDILLRNDRSGPFIEIASGAFLRTYIYEEIVTRMLELGNIITEPVIIDGIVKNPEELAGFAPFIEFVHHYGGLRKSGGFGVGDKRMLAAVLRSELVSGIHDVMAWSRDPREKYPLL